MTKHSRKKAFPRGRSTLWGLSFASCLALTTAALPQEAEAKPMRGSRRVGLGGGIGDPFGPSLKIFLHPLHALQFDLGWAPLHHGEGITHINYFFHIPPFVSNDVMDFGLYLGGGIGVAFWGRRCHNVDGPDPDPHPDDRYCRRGYWGHYGYRYYDNGGAALIIRAPIGAYFHWQSVPVDTVIESGWSPYLAPFWDPPHVDFSIKARYYF